MVILAITVTGCYTIGPSMPETSWENEELKKQDMQKISDITNRILESVNKDPSVVEVKHIYLSFVPFNQLDMAIATCDQSHCPKVPIAELAKNNGSYKGFYVIEISQGTMRYVRNDDELAVILAQGIGLAYTGGADSASSRAGGKYLAQALFGLPFSKVVIHLVYTDEEEMKAVRIGVEAAYKARYDVKKGIGVWRRISKEAPEKELIRISHPMSEIVLSDLENTAVAAQAR